MPTRPRQSEFPFAHWGGARRGAGRKPAGERACVPHRTRARFARPHPVHVTARLRAALPSLRTPVARTAIEHAFRAGRDRLGLRLVHYSIQSNHLHLLVEAADTLALCRGTRGLLGRSAKSLNGTWGRRGPVFEDRYHVHVLRTPREVRNALRYILGNSAKHGTRSFGPDPCSSARWLDPDIPEESRAIVPPATWLVRVGWRGRAAAPRDGSQLERANVSAAVRAAPGRPLAQA